MFDALVWVITCRAGHTVLPPTPARLGSVCARWAGGGRCGAVLTVVAWRAQVPVPLCHRGHVWRALKAEEACRQTWSIQSFSILYVSMEMTL